MEQLLSIKHIPIEIEVNVQRAEMKSIEESKSRIPSVNATHKDNNVLLEANPAIFDISSEQSSNRFDYYNQAAPSDSLKLTYDAIAKFNQADDEKEKNKPTHFNVQKSAHTIESILNSLPKSHENSIVSFDNGKLNVNYSMNGDELTPDDNAFEFIPGKIEFIINQMPELEIEYLGDPIYFPRSADPNYEPAVDVIA